MLERFLDRINKGLRYLLTPLSYKGKTWGLYKLVFSNRPLVRELVNLSAHRLWFDSNDFSSVLDIGAYIGAYALAIDGMLPKARVYAFEAIPENYQKFSMNLAGYDQIKVFNTALGEKEGEVSFWENAFSPSSSVLPIEKLHQEAFPQTANQREIKVKMSRLDDCLSEMDLRGRTLMKLDVQGYELQVLLGAEETLKQVDVIMTEVSYQPLYEGQATFDQLNDFLGKRGFEFSGSFEPLLSPQDGSILQTDALFVRKTK